jgi:hypothetical protein
VPTAPTRRALHLMQHHPEVSKLQLGRRPAGAVPRPFLSPGQGEVVRWLHCLEKVYPSEVAQDLRVAQQTLSRILRGETPQPCAHFALLTCISTTKRAIALASHGARSPQHALCAACQPAAYAALIANYDDKDKAAPRLYAKAGAFVRLVELSVQVAQAVRAGPVDWHASLDKLTLNIDISPGRRRSFEKMCMRVGKPIRAPWKAGKPVQPWYRHSVSILDRVRVSWDPRGRQNGARCAYAAFTFGSEAVRDVAGRRFAAAFARELILRFMAPWSLVVASADVAIDYFYWSELLLHVDPACRTDEVYPSKGDDAVLNTYPGTLIKAYDKVAHLRWKGARGPSHLRDQPRVHRLEKTVAHDVDHRLPPFRFFARGNPFERILTVDLSRVEDSHWFIMLLFARLIGPASAKRALERYGEPLVQHYVAALAAYAARTAESICPAGQAFEASRGALQQALNEIVDPAWAMGGYAA